MFNFSGGNHDKEHERLIRLMRFYPLPVTTLPAATTANTGQRVTYGNADYYSDGTRWLSVNRFCLQLIYATGITFPASATASSVLRAGAPDNTLAIYIEKMVVRAVTNTTLDVTNNWTVELWRQDTAAGTTQLGTANTFQAARVAGTPYLNTITLNTAYTLANIIQLFVTVTKNSAPGTLAFDPAVVWYRLIAA